MGLRTRAPLIRRSRGPEGQTTRRAPRDRPSLNADTALTPAGAGKGVGTRGHASGSPDQPPLRRALAPGAACPLRPWRKVHVSAHPPEGRCVPAVPGEAIGPFLITGNAGRPAREDAAAKGASPSRPGARPLFPGTGDRQPIPGPRRLHPTQSLGHWRERQTACRPRPRGPSWFRPPAPLSPSAPYRGIVSNAAGSLISLTRKWGVTWLILPVKLYCSIELSGIPLRARNGEAEGKTAPEQGLRVGAGIEPAVSVQGGGR